MAIDAIKSQGNSFNSTEAGRKLKGGLGMTCGLLLGMAFASAAAHAQMWSPVPYNPNDRDHMFVRQIGQECRQLAAQADRLIAQVSQSNRQQSESDFVAQLCAETRDRADRILRGDYTEEEARQWAMQARACQLIGDSCASQTYSAQLQGESAARAAVHDANYRYATETGKNFNVENRPVASGAAQNAWDDCNRIHRIYR